jgi:cell division protein FtsI (penicillin-binding protein 3)
MSRTESQKIRRRSLLVAFLFSAFLAVIGGKAAHIQIFQHTRLSQMAADQYVNPVTTRGKRGTIYDRRMSELALSVKSTSIAAHPPKIDDPARTAASLSKVLKMDRRQLTKQLKLHSAFVWVKRQATPLEVEKIRELALQGVGFVPEYTRFYPSKTLAAQVIGFAGIDGNGLEGLEYYYDRYLKGGESRIVALRDARGNRIRPADEPISVSDGRNLVLTIDRTIQFIAEKTLAETVSRYRAASGIAIVMDPTTGAVLAMAHDPLFNPNAFGEFKRERWRNRAITDPIEPGSTLKIFNAAAAIEAGGSSPNTIFFCENGAYRIGRNVVNDTTQHGWLSLQQIIKYSSNIGAIKISEMLGPELLHKTLGDFGFGKRTGLDCPGETAGSLSHYTDWTPMDTAAVSFGHGIAASPIQLITAFSALANGGVLMKPYLVQAVVDADGKTVHAFQPRQVRQVVSRQTAATLSNILKTVITEGGTGTLASVNGYSVCGKTGTAQKINDDGTYADDRYIASFVGYTPAAKPALSILVIIDEPQGEYYGGTVAAPAFRRIAEETLNYLNVPPDGNRQLAVARRNGGPG